MILDKNGRAIEYLRISVTPSCNLKCSYCIPEEQIIHPGNKKLLTIKQIMRLTTIYAASGIKKVRITGGEPLLRKGIATLIKGIKAVEGVEVVMTSNGTLLDRHLSELISAGLDRITISLDSLRAERLRKICGEAKAERAITNLMNLLKTEQLPVKVNMVTMRGTNDDEIADFLKLAHDYKTEVRFIEVMPVDGGEENDGSIAIKSEEIKKMAEKIYPLTAANATKRHGPAMLYKIIGGKGLVGFISPLSSGFCDGCNRMRLTADGKLHACLFSNEEVDLMEGFETNRPDSWFIERLHAAIAGKPEFDNNTPPATFNRIGSMSNIGG